MKLTKVIIEYKFNQKRNLHLLTPCCNKNNKDGKFSTYVGLPDQYGYCHSCGVTSLPPNVYKDENGNEYIWNDVLKKYEPIGTLCQHISPLPERIVEKRIYIEKPKKYIEESEIWIYFKITQENNLLKYLRNTYGNKKVEDAKETYLIGTSKDGGTVFWNINSELKVQKAKISYYNEDGKRTNKFVVPYKNEDGYLACLFGGHLIYDKIKGKKTIILVESEKTAIVGYIIMPEYIWVAYGGSNGLTDDKIKPLIGHTVLIIPDMSESAENIIYEKIPAMMSMGINAKIWDMTEGKTDAQMKTEGIYNNDLEDVFRKLSLS